jgi:hypothetical protein
MVIKWPVCSANWPSDETLARFQKRLEAKWWPWLRKEPTNGWVTPAWFVWVIQKLVHDWVHGTVINRLRKKW